MKLTIETEPVKGDDSRVRLTVRRAEDDGRGITIIACPFPRPVALDLVLQQVRDLFGPEKAGS